ncbi:hypothetical protein [Moraxella sp. ZY210820]|uniref:hypothetical protein n=1 Tax=unclassified Moraxella TaxID=2685852 RepID=UPI002731F8C7|nr:hypothetical protein [Moraxella sp. ZY210820]WLF84593.1 hypothetical protein LU301_03730 [Moraxella sp. ZY210820]
MSYSELIKTLIIDPIAIADELWVFKIEIFKHSQKGYFATLWRLDMYNIQPTFPTVTGHIASESFFIDDSFRFDGLGLYGDDLKYFKTLDDCQTYVLKCISDNFNLS